MAIQSTNGLINGSDHCTFMYAGDDYPITGSLFAAPELNNGLIATESLKRAINYDRLYGLLRTLKPEIDVDVPSQRITLDNRFDILLSGDSTVRSYGFSCRSAYTSGDGILVFEISIGVGMFGAMFRRHPTLTAGSTLYLFKYDGIVYVFGSYREESIPIDDFIPIVENSQCTAFEDFDLGVNSYGATGSDEFYTYNVVGYVKVYGKRRNTWDEDISGFGYWNVIVPASSRATLQGTANTGGGGYPVPTSLIPLRDTINHPGINYRNGLVLYDETNFNNRNMFLTNKVGEIPYKLIEFSSPGGTIRVNTNLQFTHFIGPSFTSDWTPRVYRVTTYRTVAENVMDYDFTIDYLKDYWQHFGVTDDNAPICLRTTDSTSWLGGETNMIDDIAMYTGTITATNYNLTVLPYANLPGSDATEKAWFMVAFADGDSYVMDHADYGHLTRTIKTFANGAMMAAAIAGVYLVPPNSYLSGFTEQTNAITVTGPDGASCTASLGDGSCKRFTGTVTSSAGGRATSRYYMDIPQTDIFANWHEKSAQWEMYIPYYGIIRPSAQLLQDINNEGIRLFAYIDPINGLIAIEGNNYGVMGDFISLPSVPVPSAASNYYSVQNLDTQTNQSIGKSALGITGGLIAAGVGIATGNAIAVAGGLGSIGTSLVSTGYTLETAKNQREQLAANTYSTYSGGGGTASLCSNTIKLSRYLPDLLIDLPDYYNKVGYPNNRLWKDTGAVSGKRYWISFLGEIKGTTEYKNGVLADIQSEAVVYNY